MNNEKLSNIPKYSILGAVLYMASIFTAQSLIYPVMDDLFSQCETGYLASDLGTECVHTPFITVGVLGAIIFLVLLTVLGKSFNIKRKGYIWVTLAYILLTFLLGMFRKDFIYITNDVVPNIPEGTGVGSIFFWLGQPLSEQVSIGYSYLNTWLHIVAGMLLGTVIAIFSSDKKPVVKKPKATKALAAKTKTKSAAKKNSSSKAKTAVKKATKVKKPVAKKKAAAKKPIAKKAATKKKPAAKKK